MPEKTLPKSINKKIEFNSNIAKGIIIEYNDENRKFLSWQVTNFPKLEPRVMTMEWGMFDKAFPKK